MTEVVPAFVLTRKGGFLPHGLKLGPGSRALFEPFHLCPVYLSSVVAGFAAQGDVALYAVDAVGIVRNTPTGLEADAPMAQWASMIEMGARVALPVWTARQRVEAAMAAAACADERQDFIVWASQFLRGGMLPYMNRSRSHGDHGISQLAVDAVRVLLGDEIAGKSPDEAEASRLAVTALDRYDLVEACRIVEEAYAGIPQREADAVFRLGGEGVAP